LIANTETNINYEVIDSLVARVMSVEDTTLGSQKQGYIVRYRGRIRLEDTSVAYDNLAALLKPYNLTPLFRWDSGRHAILIVQGMPQLRQSDARINLLLGVLTIASVLYTGAIYGGESLPTDFFQAILAVIERGWPFAISLLAILGAHEFGHYLMGRYHGVHVTLPYFIPLPAISPFSILYLLAKFVTFGKLLPSPVTYGSAGPILYWLRYFFTGQPLPLGGLDVNLSAVAWAGWAGLLVTAMNLVPAGQLDGGHVLYVLLGREKARRILPFIIGGLLLLSLAWSGWLIWAALIFFVGRVYAEPLDQVTPLDSRRKWLAVLALVIFLLTFTPIPLNIMVGG